MSALFGGSTPTVKYPSAPKTEDMTTENAANAERLRRAMAQGRQSTMLTSVRNTGMPTISRNTLLGGVSS